MRLYRWMQGSAMPVTACTWRHGKRVFPASTMSQTWTVLLLYVALGTTAVTGVAVNITVDMDQATIGSIINSSANADEPLVVSLGPGHYSHAQASIILTTRVSNIAILGTEGLVRFSCSNDTYIEILQSSNYTLGDTSMTHHIVMEACPIFFMNPTDHLSLTKLEVTGGRFVDTGIIAAMVVYRNQSATGYANIRVSDCLFQENLATPLLMEVPGSCVRIEHCQFQNNNFSIGSVAINALSRRSSLRVFSAGLALGIGTSPPAQEVCSEFGWQASIDNTIFTSNEMLLYNTVNLTSVLAGVDPSTLLKSMNGGLSACGIGAYLYMMGNDSAAGYTGGFHLSGTTFESCVGLDLSTASATGSGVCIHHGYLSSLWSVEVSDAVFVGNKAERSAGLHVSFDHSSQDNTFRLLRGNFSLNAADPHDSHTYYQSRGGAASIDFRRNSNGNTASFSLSTFYMNRASEGGGVHVNYHSAEKENWVKIERSGFSHNRAISGAAIYSVASHQQGMVSMPSTESSREIVVQVFRYCTIIQDCSFEENRAYTSGTVSVSFAHLVFNGNVTFRHNKNSAISLVNAYLYLNRSSHLTLYRNIAGLGGGIYLTDSQVILYDDVRVLIDGNIAQTTGGGIHANMHTRSVGLVAQELSPHCFMTYYIIGKKLADWTTNVTFQKNMAGEAGAGIFAPDFTPCLFLAQYDEQAVVDTGSIALFKERWDEEFFNGTGGNIVNTELAIGSPYGGPRGASSEGIPSIEVAWSKRWLPTVTYEMIEADPDFDGQSQTNTLSTDVVDIEWVTTTSCPDNPVKGPDGDVEVSCYVSSGEYFSLQGMARDQFNQPRDALVMVLPQTDDDDHKANNTLIATSPYLELHDNTTSDLAVLGRIGDRANFSLVVVGTARLVVDTLHLTFVDCPHGFNAYVSANLKEGKDHKCHCLSSKADSDVRLCEGNRRAYLYQGYWGGDDRDEDCNGNITALACRGLISKHFYTAVCPLGYCKTTKSKPIPCETSSDGVGCLYDFTDQNRICAHNRSGALCGKCPPGTTNSINVEDGKCDTCSNSDLYRVISFVLVIPIVIAMILLLNIPLSNDLRGLFFFAAVSRSLICPDDTVLREMPAITTILILGEVAWPSNTCVIPGINSLFAILLSYAPAVGSLLVTLLFHMLPRCSKRINSWMGQSDQNTLKHGTWLIIFFCFQKMMQLSIKIFTCVQLFGEWRFFYEGDLRCYTSSPHAYFFFGALTVVIALGVLMIICALKAMDHSFPCIRSKSDLFVSSVLRRGLRENCRAWAVWDLFRRAAIFFGTMLVVKGCEGRQIYMLCCSVVIFTVHMVAQPYKDPEETDKRCKLVTWSTPGFLSTGKSCNILEGAILFNMVMMAGFSLVYRHYEDATRYILTVLSSWPIICFFALFAYKFVVLLILRCNERLLKRLLRVSPSTDDESGRLVNGAMSGGDSTDGGIASLRAKKPLREGMLVPLLDCRPVHGQYNSTSFHEDDQSC